MSAMKAALHKEVADGLRDLTESPLYGFRRERGYLPVVGEGDPDARIMFAVGAGPR